MFSGMLILALKTISHQKKKTTEDFFLGTREILELNTENETKKKITFIEGI